MSRFLNGISNPSSLIHKRGGGCRMFSSYVSGPFAKFGIRERYDLRRDDVHLFDVSKEKDLFVPDKEPPEELNDTKLKATTLGWGLYHKQNHKYGNAPFFISDHLNPLASKPKSEAKGLFNVSFSDTCSQHDYSCQSEFVCNMAMSSYPYTSYYDYDEDWILAIKFFGRRLNIRTNTGGWRNIAAPWHSFQNSSVMYSNKDRKFYLPAPGSNYLCSWDLHVKHHDEDQNPTFHHYQYVNIPKLSQSEYEFLNSCSKAEHWVESPSSGERFLVKCYSFVSPSSMEPVLMVFREVETSQGGRCLCYTEDIGDVCIFISRVNTFCLEATSCPGLKPNSIYLVEPVFGVYDLATRNIRRFEVPKEAPLNPGEEFEAYFPPHWLPPVSL